MKSDLPILIIGGDADPNLIRMLKVVSAENHTVHPILLGSSGVPSIMWDVNNNKLELDGKPLSASCAFIRRDVFKFLNSQNKIDDYNASEFYIALLGWLLANPNIKIFNRSYLAKSGTNKAHVLSLAVELGLPVAKTIISNHLDQIKKQLEGKSWISKPLGGGEYTKSLTDADIKAAGTRASIRPTFIQQRLEQPELRVFRVGSELFSFWVKSDVLDYRASKTTKLEVAETPEVLGQKLIKLCDTMLLDFAAADFKTCSETKELMLLEVNSNPMFAGFDQAVSGKLIGSMLKHLLS